MSISTQQPVPSFSRLDINTAAAYRSILPPWAHRLLLSGRAIGVVNKHGNQLAIGRRSRGDPDLYELFLFAGDWQTVAPKPCLHQLEQLCLGAGTNSINRSWTLRLRLPVSLWTRDWKKAGRELGWTKPLQMRTYCARPAEQEWPAWLLRAERAHLPIWSFADSRAGGQDSNTAVLHDVSQLLIRDEITTGKIEVVKRERGLLYRWLYLASEERSTLAAGALLARALRAHISHFPQSPALFFSCSDRPEAFRMYERAFSSFCTLSEDYVIALTR